MKKFILPAIILLAVYTTFLVPIFADEAYAQEKEPIGCEEVREILGSEGCQHFVIDGGDIWCSQTGEEIIPEESAQGLKFPYKNRPPDYMIDRSSDFFSENTELAAKCLDRSGSQETNAQPDQPQSGQTGKQKKQSQDDGNPLNIFGVNPFQTWLNLNAFAEAGAFIKSGAAERFTETTIQHMVGVEPLWEREAREEAAFNKFLNSSQGRLDKLGKIDSEEILGDFDNRLESVDKPVMVKKDSAAIQLHPLDGQTGVLDPGGGKLMLKSGGVDATVEPQEGQQFQMQTPNAEILVIGTEFSVVYDNKKNKAIVAVYKGKVEVKTRDGQITTVSPDGDKPGVAVIAQKPSTTKLAIAGAALAAAIGGVIFLLRKRAFKTTFPKKKTSR